LSDLKRPGESGAGGAAPDVDEDPPSSRRVLDWVPYARVAQLLLGRTLKKSGKGDWGSS